MADFNIQRLPGSLQPPGVQAPRHTPAIAPRVEVEAPVRPQDDRVTLSPLAQRLLAAIASGDAERIAAVERELQQEQNRRLFYTLRLLRERWEDAGPDQERPRRRQHDDESEEQPLPLSKTLTRADDLLSAMIVFAEDPRMSRRLIEALQVTGPGIVQVAYRFGTRMVLLPAGVSACELGIDATPLLEADTTTCCGEAARVARRFYDHGEKLVVVGDEVVARGDASELLHVFGHALDHAWSVQHQQAQLLSAELWTSGEDERRGFISERAAGGSIEYFADSFAAWFDNAAHPRLRKLDPTVASFIDGLVAGSHAPS